MVPKVLDWTADPLAGAQTGGGAPIKHADNVHV